MKKLFLGLFFLRKKLHIVYYQQVVLPICVFESGCCSCLESIAVVNSEFLRSEIERFTSLILLLELIAYSLDQMGLATTCVAINKQRVVGYSRAIKRCLSGCVGKLIE